MKIRVLVPALLALAGCATTPAIDSSRNGAPVQASVAAPQQVDAVSDALGAKLDNMVAARRVGPTTITR